MESACKKFSLCNRLQSPMWRQFPTLSPSMLFSPLESLLFLENAKNASTSGTSLLLFFSAWNLHSKISLWHAPTLRIVSAQMSFTRYFLAYLYKRSNSTLRHCHPFYTFIFLTALPSSDSLYIYLLVCCQFPTEPGTVSGTQNKYTQWIFAEWIVW